ncbi:P-loop containing nucleoside triphosphate hydrolase protein [Apodospora peruviana]|uniref:P-loop containing nucleoside triphosphate hydrolase protein n=1 Tax=Apodospora peruviana TaxID=516989 RepID=A0AAE0M7G2_9PEZI|nr:P-loop containing nucleoside triphosphate hydrolase protein [Apodospora peruviana]
MPGRTINDIGAESSRKRSRAAVSFQAYEDDEVVDVQRARSNLRGETRKRARVSGSELTKDGRRPNRESTPESSEGDDATHIDQQTNAQGSPDSPPKTQYELLRDNNFEHLRHEATDDQRATQRLRFRPNLLGDNAVADNGIIESITCVNFMCHERLHCELGPLLNFIVGENGSGKSAILTAITLCLGGKASSTNRGGSLKSFVKEGCERAVLTVKIKNQGQDAYRHELYGDSIIVERHFSKAGASGFKVKTALGQTISTKKQEVEEIVEYYALQVDNPLNVLSQDNARQFLNASTKTQKYKFFIEGVQLQQLDNDYRLISESLEQMVAKVPDQEARVQHAKEALAKANRLKEAIEGNRQIRVKHRTLRNMMIWAQVVEEERELARREKTLAEASIKVAEAERDVEEKTQALQVADEKIERAQQNVMSVKEEEREVRDRVVITKEASLEAAKVLHQIHVDEREAHSSLKNAKTHIRDLELKIAAEEQRLEDANGEAHSIKTRELKEAEADVEKIIAEIAGNKARGSELSSQTEEAGKALKQIDDEFQRKRGEVEVAQAKIEELEKSAGGLYDGFEAQLPKLLHMIAHEKSFAEKPIGPLGAHVKLLKPQWSAILEQFMGPSLSAFLVTSSRDQKILKGLADRAGVKNCPILIGKKNPLDLSGKEPEESFDTILRVLNIDNQRVRDQLIIAHSIEQTILVPERTRAEDVMFGGAGPRNVRACLCFQDGKRGQGLILTNRRGNGIATEPITNKNINSRPRMQTDMGSQVAFQKETLQQLETEYRVMESSRRRVQQDLQRFQKELIARKKKKYVLETRLRTARVRVGDLEAALDEFDGTDGRLQGLREQLEDAKRKEEHFGTQYGALHVMKQEKNKVAEDAKAKLTTAKLQVTDFEARLLKAEEKLRRFQDTRRIILTELNEAVTIVELSKEAKEKAEGKRTRQFEHIASITEEAKKVCEHRMDIAENATYQSIERQYEALGKRLREQEKKTGMSDEQVHDYVVESKKAYDKVVSDLESIKEVNAGLRATLNLRLEKWRKFQRYISSQSRANFIYLLSERGFRGKLLLDHERKALDLQVEPDKTEKRAAGRNTKTLSGGEKSFSSICLLLSIWEAMGSPLRCLDEFDVFMDNVNRAISTNMLVRKTLPDIILPIYSLVIHR